jgi:hypothetical protein
MDRRPWLERAEGELARRGVPARGRRRLIAEWRDHLADLMDEGLPMTATESKMGDPAAVAAGAAEQYRRAGWVRRHPLLTFGLTPLPVVLATFVGMVLVLELSALAFAELLYGDAEQIPRAHIVRLMYGFNYCVRFLPFAVITAWFTRMYLRSGVSVWWYATGVGQVLLIAGTLVSEIYLRDEPGQSTWMVGFAWMPVPISDGQWVLPYLPKVGWPQLAQLAAPLAVVGALFALARRRELRRLAAA